MVDDGHTESHLEADLARSEAEASELKDRLLRQAAEQENFKKRQLREQADAIAFANESFARSLLPVLDNLRRAVGAAEREPAVDHEVLVEGVKLVERQLEDALARFDVVGFSAVGEPFDPARHEVLTIREDPEVPKHVVLDEVGRGYLIHDRLLRPALVVLSSGPGEQEIDAERLEARPIGEELDEELEEELEEEQGEAEQLDDQRLPS